MEKWYGFLKKVCFLSVIALAFIGCQNKGRIEYYRKVFLLNPNRIKFTYPLDKQKAADINCYYCTYNDKGKPVEIAFMKHGQNADSPNYGFHKLLIEYNNNEEKWKFLNSNGKPGGDSSVYYYIFKLDENGTPLSCTNFDTSDHIVEDSLGVAKRMFKTDSSGNFISELNTNARGEYISDKEGVYEHRYSYDSDGNLIEEAYFDKQGKAQDSKNGIAKLENVSDSLGNCVLIKFFNSNGEPAIDSLFMAASMELKYDNRGNRIESKMYDTEGRISADSNLIASILRMEYDDINEKIQESYYDSRDRLSEIRKLDNGQVIEHSYWSGKDTLRANDSTGCAITRYKWDKEGNLIELSSYDVNGLPADDATAGVAVIKNTYDKDNNKTSIECYGVDGNLKINKNGFASRRTKYDDRGNVMENAFYGPDNKPILPSGYGYFRVERKDDYKNHTAEIKYYDTEGRLVVPPNKGYALSKIQYDKNGNVISKELYDDKGNRINH